MTTKSPLPPNRNKTKSPVKEVLKQQTVAPIRLKTVVRRLPANLPESIFWQSVQPWVSDETASWKTFYPGKLRKKLNKENIPSRAYVLFKNEEYLAAFSREYDGHLFRDKQGNESQAVVEFAPNQKAPPEKRKPDSRHATIHQDEDYLSFVSSLQNRPIKPVEVDVEALLASTLPPEEPKITPLLAALREQKLSVQEKKLATAEGKTHSRKGGAAAPLVQKQDATDPTSSTGKKGKKGKSAPPTVFAPPTATVANLPSTRSGGGGRSRGGPTQVPASGASSGSTLAMAPSGKEPTTSAESEPTQRKSRPMLGLQSRHLKAALSGAGVQVAPASTSTSSSIVATSLPSVPTAAAATSVVPTGSASRGPRGRGGGEKRFNDGVEDGTAKSSGGRGGGGKEKGRPRHPPSNQAPVAAPNRLADATPRILSRQDPPSAFSAADAPPRDRNPASGSQDPGVGGGRGKGSRKGRGQT